MLTIFQEDVASLVDAFKNLGGNMFLETSGKLFDLKDRIIMPDEVVESIKNLESVGQKKYELFVKERLVDQTRPVSDPIKHSGLKFFRYGLSKKINKPVTSKTRAADKAQSQLLIDVISADSSGRRITPQLLGHESSKFPPTLTKDGAMYHPGNKAELLDCIIPPETEHASEEIPREHPDKHCTAAILDGSVVIRFLRPPPDCKDLEAYVHQVVMPYIESYFQRGYRRIDMVFDFYLPDSLKKEVRQSRGTGKAVMVELSTKRPGDWQGFLSVDSNKLALFELIVRYLIANLNVPEVSFHQVLSKISYISMKLKSFII